MARPRILLLLRIAVSVVCGILCLLLIALWVRSYSWLDSLTGRYQGTVVIAANSTEGRLILSKYDLPPHIGTTTGWQSSRLAKIRPSGPFVAGFGFNQNRKVRGTMVVAPLWFPTLLAFALASAPWLPWSRRFSLRTLLLATTLVAVVLGLVVAMR